MSRQPPRVKIERKQVEHNIGCLGFRCVCGMRLSFNAQHSTKVDNALRVECKCGIVHWKPWRNK